MVQSARTRSAVADVLRTAATVPTACALVVIVVAGVRSIAVPAHAADTWTVALRLALEFLLAGGLLRLSATQSLGALGVTAAIVAVRQVIARGLTQGRRAAARTASS
jgi:Protein of unknown function (DUF1622)